VTKPINIPNVFAAATSAIPLSQLDQDFSTLANATNDLATYSNYVADTGAANAFIANYPVNTNTGSLTTGLRLQFKAANANSGASTLNVQVNGASIGTASIRLTDGSALPANTIIAGAMVDVMYDGTNFQLMNDPSGGQEVITNLTLSGNLTVTGTSNFTGNVTANVANTTTSTITNLSSGNVTITGGTISNVTLDNVTVDVETFSNITINGTATFAAGTVSAPSITTSGDTNTGIFFPAADTIAFTEGGVESMRIDSSGNVGIGTSSPASKLSVNGSAFVVGRTIPSSGVGAEIYWSGTGTGIASYDRTNSLWKPLNLEAELITLNTNAAERMRIDSSGNVGIGTSSPTARLDVAAPQGIVKNTSTTGTNAVDFRVTNTGGTTYFGRDDSTGSSFGTAPYATVLWSSGAYPMVFTTNSSERMRIGANGDVLFNGDPFVYSFAGGTAGAVRSGIKYDGTNTRMEFYTAQNERMRITSGGYTKFSNDGTYDNATDTYHESRQTANNRTIVISSTNASLTTDGSVFIAASRNTTNNTFYALSYYNAGAAAFKFRIADSGNATNTNGSYGTISDAKLKENIVDATPKLDKVNQLKVRNYNFINDELKQIGFVAQEFEQVFPSMVEESADKDADGNDLGTTTKTIKTTVLIPILVKAIQELNAKVEAQAAEIALLKSK
jgi:hypothetical protein